MKKFIGLCTLLALTFPAFSCDEACQREQATANGADIPGYLTWQFCEDTKASFMAGDIRSLEKYRHEKMNIKYKGNMRNIMNFVNQRKEWLAECDQYFQVTNNGRIFSDDATTEKIFGAMEQVAEELQNALNGTTYVSGNSSGDETTIVGNKFDTMFKLVDDHRVIMMRKGQFVRN